MTDQEKQLLRALIQAALPFLSDDTVDVTGGTMPLMNALEQAIDDWAKLLDEDPHDPSKRYDPNWADRYR